MSSVSSTASCEQRAGERDVVEAEVGQDHRHAERVRDVGIAGAAHLVAVRVARDDVGPFDDADVGVGPARPHPVDQRPQRSVEPARARLLVRSRLITCGSELGLDRRSTASGEASAYS